MRDSVAKRTVILMFGVSMLAVTYALVHVDSAQHAPQDVHAIKQNAYQITAQSGSAFSIVLPSIPTAGYSWKITKIDGSYIKLTGQKYERFVPEELKDKDFVGGTGTEHFEFRALKKGATELVLHYGRPWEAEPVEIRAYHVTIE